MVHFDRVAVETPSYIRLFALARGGMGSVDLGLRTEGTFSRLVAIKRPKTGDDDDQQALRMFLDEASITGLIRHPHVVNTYDFGHDSDGPFLVMEYVEGNSLRHLLDLLEAAQEQLPVQHALKILADAARGLHAAHSLKTVTGESMPVVHRDVSPGNIMLGIDGECKVADFGIAKIWGKGTKTETGILKGKIGYLSPEQLRFQIPDHRADLYSLGVVLYEMVAGRRLHESSDFREVAWRTVEGEIPDLGEARVDCPPALVQLCAQMLAKDPAQRPANAKEVAERAAALHREIIDEEGADDFAEYLQEFFEHDLETLQTRVRNVLARAQTPELVSGGASPVAAPREATRSAIVELDTFVRHKRRGRRHLIALAMMISFGALGWIAWNLVPQHLLPQTTAQTGRLETGAVQTDAKTRAAQDSESLTEIEPITIDIPLEDGEVPPPQATPSTAASSKARRRPRRRQRTKQSPSDKKSGELMEW